MSEGYWPFRLFSASRCFNSRSTASRMNAAIPLSPTRARILSRTSSERRTKVGFMPSAGLPMRRGISDIGISVKTRLQSDIAY